MMTEEGMDGEIFFQCGEGLSVISPALCNNGFVEPSEECDDANETDGDGCTGCKEDWWAICTGEPSVCKWDPELIPELP